MKYAVCAHYCGTTILVRVFDKEEDADAFASKITTLESFDPNDEEEYFIYPDEMWVEPYENIPFSEPLSAEEAVNIENMYDELPF